MENSCLPKFPKFSEIILAAAFTYMNLMYFQIYTFANPRLVILASFSFKDGLENRKSKMEQLLGSYKSFLLFFFKQKLQIHSL